MWPLWTSDLLIEVAAKTGLIVVHMMTVVWYYFKTLLAHLDEYPESYYRTLGVGVDVSVRVHKNFNLAYNYHELL